MITIQKTYKFKLKLCKKESALLAQFAGACRFIYNYGLGMIKDAQENKLKVPKNVDIANALPQLKKDKPWLKAVHSQILQQALKDLDHAVLATFKRAKNKQKVGFLKFKKKGTRDSFRYPQGFVIEDNKIYLPKIGYVRFIKSQDIDGIAKQVTVKKDADGWFVCIVTQKDQENTIAVIQEANTVGIDLGLLSYAYLSDDTVIDNPRFLKIDLEKLAKKQRCYARTKRGSNNRKKLAKSLGRLHLTIANKRKDFLHKLSTTIVKKYDAISLEDLNVKGMVQNRRLARSIADAGWAIFVSMLEYKCTWYNKHFVQVNRFYASSKICSSCGHKQNIALNQRTYDCISCHTKLDRDLNASKNIRAAGITVLTNGALINRSRCDVRVSVL